MIKIIERGTRTIVRCHECGCKFSYEDSDIVRGCVTCPQCGVDIPHHRPETHIDLGAISNGSGYVNLTLTNGGLAYNKSQVLDVVGTQTMGIIDTPTIDIVEPNTAGVINND